MEDDRSTYPHRNARPASKRSSRSGGLGMPVLRRNRNDRSGSFASKAAEAVHALPLLSQKLT